MSVSGARKAPRRWEIRLGILFSPPDRAAVVMCSGKLSSRIK